MVWLGYEEFLVGVPIYRCTAPTAAVPRDAARLSPLAATLPSLFLPRGEERTQDIKI